jgi:hypothetical protein
MYSNGPAGKGPILLRVPGGGKMRQKSRWLSAETILLRPRQGVGLILHRGGEW